MRLCIYGTDERTQYLRQIAEARGHLLTENRPDAVILPLPRATFSDMKRYFPNHQRFICGGIDDALKEAAHENRWQMDDVLQDEMFQLENAHLTAEGAVYKAMMPGKDAMRGKRALVVGYGRIGKSLTDMLRALGCHVTVAARRESQRILAGENSVDIDGIRDVIYRMDMVFNTVPFPVMDENVLSQCKADCLLMELAAPPYGVDMEAAQRLGVKVQIEGGLPGRYCPESAARVWMDAIERRMEQ